MSTKCVWSWYSHSSHIFLIKILHFLLSGEHPFSHTSFYLWFGSEFTVLVPKCSVQFILSFLKKQKQKQKKRLPNKQTQTGNFEVRVIHAYHPLPLPITNISSFIKWWLIQHLLYYLATHSPGGRLQGEWPIEHSSFSYSSFLYSQRSYLIYRFPWRILRLEPH